MGLFSGPQAYFFFVGGRLIIGILQYISTEVLTGDTVNL